MLTVYKASAGSGKTYTLTLEYLKLLLGIKVPAVGRQRYVLNSDRYAPGGRRQPNRHQTILAITFTNAATDEMKTRIVSRLSALAGEGPADYRDFLTSLYGCTADELRESARKALSEILYDYDRFNVSTIDSFFQTILRSFSREVDQQGDYELSLNHNDVVAQAISLMLDDINYGNTKGLGNVLGWIRNYIFDTVDRGKGFNFFDRTGSTLRNLARSVADALGSETYTEKAGEFREYMTDPARLQAFRDAMLSEASRCAAALQGAAQAVLAWAAGAGLPPEALSTLRSRLDKAAADPYSLTKKDFSAKYFDNLADDPCIDKFYTKKYIKGLGLSDATLQQVVDMGFRFYQIACDNIGMIAVYKKIADSLKLLEFISITDDYMRRFLSETNTVLISDTGEILKKIINGDDIPFIYERLGMKLQSLLIDEFQDTSHLQWENLLPLMANSLSQGYDSLIIGDEKQSIFRFRNSDSSLLGHQVPAVDFPPPASTLRGDKPSDNTNYRSAGDIVRFNNTLFSRIAAAVGSAGFGNVVQTPSAALSATPAYIRLQFTGGMTGDDGGKATQEAIFEAMAQDILREHEAGYRWNEILILVKKHKDAVAIANFLLTAHPEIRLLSSEALVLNSSPAVRTIIGILRLVERSYKSPADVDRKDPERKFANRSDVAMMISRYAYLRGEGLDAPAALEAALTGSDSGDVSDRIRDIRDENPANLVALIETIVEHKISESQRHDEYAYIAALQDLAIKHCEGPDCSLASFLAEYDRNIEKWAIQTSAKLDAVEIMTMHKSKGLERPCVHIPLANWNFRIGETLWIDTANLFPGMDARIVPPLLLLDVSKGCAFETEQASPVFAPLQENIKAIDADNLNLAYVAFTRASRELLVYADENTDIGRWLYDAVGEADSCAEQTSDSLMPLSTHYDKEKMLFTDGAPTASEGRKKTAGTPDTDAGPYVVVRREDTREVTSIDDMLSNPDTEGEPDKEITDEAGGESMVEAARRGNNLHAILASVRTRAELPDAIAAYALRFGLPEEEAESYFDELEAAFEKGGETVAAWFAPGNRVFNERAIYNPAKDETLRPDRVIVEGDVVTVIDYKFTSGIRDSHRRQVEVYKSLLHELGYAEVRGFLWYPLLERIIKV